MIKVSQNAKSAFGICIGLALMLLLRLYLSVGSGHMDEYDYLFVGKTLLSGNDWPSHSYIFGWDLNWLLLGWADNQFGGLFGARLVTSVLGLISIVGMYAFTLSLWQERTTALLAAAFLGFEAAHIHISALATYDIISFTAFTCSLPLIVQICRTKSVNVRLTIAAATLLCVAVLSKYVVLLYLPLVAVVIFWRSPLNALIGTALITAVLGIYTLLHHEQLYQLYTIQIRGAHAPNALPIDILMRTAVQLSPLLLISTLALIYSLFQRNRITTTALCLIVGASPLFIYHLLSENVISLHKHLVYTSLFLIPLVSWWLCQLFQYLSKHRLNLAVTTLLVGAIGFNTAHALLNLRTSFPNLAIIENYAHKMDGTSSVLSEDPYLFRYLLIDKAKQSNIKETNWLDNNRDGVHEDRDVKQAIWDRKFDYVFLTDQVHKPLNSELRIMLLQRNYRPVVNQYYELPTLSGRMRTGNISLYARTSSLAELLDPQ